MTTTAEPPGDSPVGSEDADGATATPEMAAEREYLIDSLPKHTRILLVLCLAVDAAIAVWLATWNATLTRTTWDVFGSALLFVIAIACVLAIGSIVGNSPSAARTTVVSQIFVACLAVYVWLVDVRSPVHQMWGVTGVALALGGIALLWVLFLSRYAQGTVSRGAVVVVALFPAFGLVQFWLQTDYLPHSSIPLIDIQAELSPAGSTGPIIHLKAKFTVHNRSSSQLDIPAGLVRMYGFPKSTATELPTPQAVAAHLDPQGSILGDYREVPAMPPDARLLYAGQLGGIDSFLAPGETTQGEAVIDIDTHAVRLVHLDVSLITVTQHAVKDIRTCYAPQKSYNSDPVGFLDDAGVLHEWTGNGQALCQETQFASRGAIEELVSDHPILRIYTVVQNSVLPTPQLVPFFGTSESLNDPPTAHMDILRTIANSTPSGIFGSSAEYAPAESDLHPSR